MSHSSNLQHMFERMLSLVVVASLILSSLALALASTVSAAHPQPALSQVETEVVGAQSPVAIDPSPYDQYQPTGAADSAGNLYAVWMDAREGADYYIRFAYRPTGGDWTPGARIDPTGDQRQEAPRIAVDGSGNAYAVWVDKRDGLEQIYFAYRSAGGSWEASLVISPTTQIQSRPALAVNRRGEAVVLWVQQLINSNMKHVFAAGRPVGGPWGAAERVNETGTFGGIWSPDVALDDWGRVYALWSASMSPSYVYHVYFASRPAGGPWGANESVRDTTVGNAFSSALAVDSAGNAHAVWHDSRGGQGSDIYAAYRPAGGPWSTNVRVNDPAGGGVAACAGCGWRRQCHRCLE